MQSAEKLTKAINYRNKNEIKAKLLLEKLIAENSFSTLLHKSKIIHILVVGAGSFPSYSPFLNRLLSLLPHLEEVHFTLVEPSKNETDLFEKCFFKQNQCNNPNVSINLNIQNCGIKEFLQNPHDSVFDVVYFEHPEMMTFPILLAKLGIGNVNIISLRESIPLLNSVLKSQALIIASCMTKHELYQIKSLLHFSFNKITLRTSTSFNPMDYFYGGPYSSGLICDIQQSSICITSQYKKITAIQKSHNYLCFFILISFVIYCIRSSHPHYFAEQMISVLFMIAQLYLHKPGKNGLAIKVSLLIGQLAL